MPNLSEIANQAYSSFETIQKYTADVDCIINAKSKEYKKYLLELQSIVTDIDLDNISVPQDITKIEIRIEALIMLLTPYLIRWSKAEKIMDSYVKLKIGVSFTKINQEVKDLISERELDKKPTDTAIVNLIRGETITDLKIKDANSTMYLELDNIIKSARGLKAALHDKFISLVNETRNNF